LNMPKIFIYLDEGVSPLSYQQTRRTFRKLFPNLTLETLDSKEIAQGLFRKEAHALVFCGGRDLPYCAKLQGAGNKQIRSYVEEGGSYIGFCAGAYYGAAHVEFDRTGPLEVLGTRELAFFPGKAIGPAYKDPVFVYNSEDGAKAALIHWKEEPNPFQVYFNGGCAFHKAETFSSVEVLARYADLEGSPAACIRCRVGEGSAFLSGVHIEFLTPTSALKKLALSPAETLARLLEKSLI
jgi:glutamine amidotransferase-like uncharacterized protein